MKDLLLFIIVYPHKVILSFLNLMFHQYHNLIDLTKLRIKKPTLSEEVTCYKYSVLVLSFIVSGKPVKNYGRIKALK